jgi:nitrogen regulatory protein P-II 1
METKLSKIEIVTSFSRFTELNETLSKLGVTGMTVIQVLGCGVQKGAREYAKDINVNMELLPKQLISIVVETERVPKVVEAVKQTLYTGHIGDGKIFISDITNVIRVRTGEEGLEALK